MQRIDVVAVALIDSDNRVLVAQRPPGKPLAGLWEFPGGKIETGERPATALVRELAEELGIRVAEADLHPLTFVAHDYSDFQLLLLLYTCTRWIGQPTGQRFDKVDRAVLAAGATDGHCEVGAMVVLEGGQPAGDEGQPIAWHKPAALGALAMPPADVPLLAPLQAFVAGK